MFLDAWKILLWSTKIWFVQGVVKNRFQLYWNLPSYSCRNDLDPENYGIITNSNQTFYGENIVIFYEHKFGLYPKLVNDKENYSKILEVVNGGLPQLVNLSAHLEKVEADIKNAISDPNFSGLAVIDYEDWRPLYDSNWSQKSIYKKESQRIVKGTVPELVPLSILGFFDSYTPNRTR